MAIPCAVAVEAAPRTRRIDFGSHSFSSGRLATIEVNLRPRAAGSPFAIPIF